MKSAKKPFEPFPESEVADDQPEADSQPVADDESGLLPNLGEDDNEPLADEEVDPYYQRQPLDEAYYAQTEEELDPDTDDDLEEDEEV